jgi:hypothetical protein
MPTRGAAPKPLADVRQNPALDDLVSDVEPSPSARPIDLYAPFGTAAGAEPPGVMPSHKAPLAGAAAAFARAGAKSPADDSAAAPQARTHSAAAMKWNVAREKSVTKPKQVSRFVLRCLSLQRCSPKATSHACGSDTSASASDALTPLTPRWLPCCRAWQWAGWSTSCSKSLRFKRAAQVSFP